MATAASNDVAASSIRLLAHLVEACLVGAPRPLAVGPGLRVCRCRRQHYQDCGSYKPGKDHDYLRTWALEWREV